METISLNGTWSLKKPDDKSTLPATVPGCVHLDLLANNQLEDPFYRDNELRQMCIGESDWVYSRTFSLAVDDLVHEHIYLRCLGLDTLAKITLNNHGMGETDNMYRTWEFDAKPYLVAGENQIEIAFAAPMPFLRQIEAEKGVLPAWSVGAERLNGGSWIRKEPCNFGWDWGPKFVTSGIWRDIDLLLLDTARITDLLILQDHSEDAVQLTLKWTVEQLSQETLTMDVEILLRDEVVIQKQGLAVDKDAVINIAKPELWYPNGMGAQPLYTVRAKLLSSEHQTLDTAEKRIGLRTLKLERHPDEWGEAFYFSVNGIPFFAKGANWIPVSPFPSDTGRDTCEQLIADSAAVNMNMLRVWGGGIYEHDVFYDLCDEYGICIWQDFMFACATYPSYDADFMQNVKAEAEDNVRRIRHHACIALWCGNNELEQGLVSDEWTEHTMSWADYEKLFDVLLADVVAELDPQGNYHAGSAHSPCGDRNDWKNPDCGDTHLWGVWHQKFPFEWYRTCLHRFVSEFGFQSFPEPDTLQSVIAQEDRNITSYVMEHRQRSGIGNSTIIHYMLDWFRLPTSFEDTIRASQIQQGMAMKYAVEHWRRNMPRTMGALYWQLNDVWQAPGWSSIDYEGRWKALHYMAKHFFAPLLISGVENAENKTVAIHITSDLNTTTHGKAAWMVTDLAGKVLLSGEINTEIPERRDSLIQTLDLSVYAAREILVWLDLTVNGASVSQNLVLMSRPKHLNLLTPGFEWKVEKTGEKTAEVTLSAEHPALWVWLDLSGHDVRLSDNYFHLRPGVTEVVTLEFADNISKDVIALDLRVKSLVDTY